MKELSSRTDLFTVSAPLTGQLMNGQCKHRHIMNPVPATQGIYHSLKLNLGMEINFLGSELLVLILIDL